MPALARSEFMKLDGDVEILDGLPLLHIKSLSALICSDLHLGYEGVMADRGTFLPKVNLKNIKDIVKKGARLADPTTLIVNGDIKNEFSDVHVEEFNEFRDFMTFVTSETRIKRVVLIKGNHDNFIDRLKKPLGFEMHTQEATLGRYLFFHGEELPHSSAGKFLIMGHVHPSISIFSKIGAKEKLRCFLYGTDFIGRRVIVLPAMNFFADGFSVNTDQDLSRLAPIFAKGIDINQMEALCLGEGEILNFGNIGKLHNIEI